MNRTEAVLEMISRPVAELLASLPPNSALTISFDDGRNGVPHLVLIAKGHEAVVYKKLVEDFIASRPPESFTKRQAS